jgi:hypothetical protein
MKDPHKRVFRLLVEKRQRQEETALARAVDLVQPLAAIGSGSQARGIHISPPQEYPGPKDRLLL